MNHYQLSRVSLSGFKSIRKCDLDLKKLNVLIGPNGVGKSNFISFFRMIQQSLSGKLQIFVSKQGGPDALLHFGRKTTANLGAELYFGNNHYKFILEPTQDHRMIFTNENFFLDNQGEWKATPGFFESEIESQNPDPGWYRLFTPIMKTWQIYHFHDTSDTAIVKQKREINDNAYLRSDAGNLAAFLYRLQKKFPQHYQKIVSLVRLIAPFFGDFHLRPNTDNPEYIELEWIEKGEDKPFKAYQLSDGTLRFMCLATVLNQPEEFLPETILIDEPELGLHPRAIGILASMFRSTSKRAQVIICTQSVTLVNGFSVGDLIVVDRDQGLTTFRRHDEQKFEEWLKEYTVGDLWEKNLLGGRG